MGEGTSPPAPDLQTDLSEMLADMRRLHATSTRLIVEGSIDALYREILEGAAALMRAEMGTMQMLDRARGELRLLCSRGFDGEWDAFFKWVSVESSSTCGEALRTGKRVLVPDVERCSFMKGTDDLDAYRKAGVRSLQSTPLMSRSGDMLGMISTHWSVRHRPTDHQLELLDVLARQAADLIERSQTEQTLRDADRHKDEFLALLSHELRNPLAAIHTGLQQLRRNGGASNRDKIHAIMERQVVHLVRLVDDLMDVSRLTRGKMELQKERTALSDIIENAIEATQHLVDDAGHTLTVSLPSETLTLHADVVRLTQVFANLINNAVKYTPKRGRIWVTAKRDHRHVVVTVRDSGIGIPSDKLRKIFDIFEQAGGQAGVQNGGLGVGLMLVRGIVELHGGEVEAFTEGVDRGSEFRVRLPLALTAGEAPQASAETRIRKSSPRVLLVEDNRDVADALSMLLETLGAEVEAVHDGGEALERLMHFAPALILLDLGLPGMDGWELARRIRAVPGYGQVLLVALTGWGQETNRARTREAGLDRHLLKPVAAEKLQALLDEVSGP